MKQNITLHVNTPTGSDSLEFIAVYKGKNSENKLELFAVAKVIDGKGATLALGNKEATISIETQEESQLPVNIYCMGIFHNPDPNAKPLADLKNIAEGKISLTFSKLDANKENTVTPEVKEEAFVSPPRESKVTIEIKKQPSIHSMFKKNKAALAVLGATAVAIGLMKAFS